MEPRRWWARPARHPARAAASLLAVVALLAAAAEEAVVPTETCRGLFIVPLSFGEGEEKTLHLLLDTGASPTSVDPDSIRRVFGTVVTAGKRVKLRDGSAGPLQVRSLKVTAHPMGALSRAIGTEIDGILGFHAFRDLLLTLDYPAGEVRVGEGKLPEPDGEEVFRDYGKSRPFVALDLGEEKVPLLIDSGYTGLMRLRGTDPLPWEVAPVPLGASVRYRGVRINEGGRLARDLAVGPLTVKRPVVQVGEGTRLVGAKALGRLSLTFDHRSRRIRMVLGEPGPLTVPSERGLGAALRPQPEGLEIIAVFEDTPAEAAGLRRGDLVTAIDGQEAYSWGCNHPLADGGRERVRLTYRREGTETEIVLEPAVLVP